MLTAMPLLVVGAALASGVRPETGHLEIRQKFEGYKRQFLKDYRSRQAETKAFEAFVQNEQFIREVNSKQLSYWLGHNEFSDLTHDEFLRKFLNRTLTVNNSQRRQVHQASSKPAALPASVDWLKAGAVTAVKNQGQCGGCWAFSAVGAMEGAYQIAGNPLTQFSEQQLISCDTEQSGCTGGIMSEAFTWISENGICSEDAFPYSSSAGVAATCDGTCSSAATAGGFISVKDEAGMMDALATEGPLSIGVDASSQLFQLYKGGVIVDPTCGTKLDHGMVVVGYGDEAVLPPLTPTGAPKPTPTPKAIPYYKIKNSWGVSWGERGYVRMGRGTNQCGVSEQVSYPTKVKVMHPAPTHYSNPSVGCLPDERKLPLPTGTICAPMCFRNGSCPMDRPRGVTAVPECVLLNNSSNSSNGSSNGSSSSTFCALPCNVGAEISACGAASCKATASVDVIGNASGSAQNGGGVCIYPAKNSPSPSPFSPARVVKHWALRLWAWVKAHRSLSLAGGGLLLSLCCCADCGKRRRKRGAGAPRVTQRIRQRTRLVRRNNGAMAGAGEAGMQYSALPTYAYAEAHVHVAPPPSDQSTLSEALLPIPVALPVGSSA